MKKDSKFNSSEIDQRFADLERRIDELERRAAEQMPIGWPPIVPKEIEQDQEPRCPVCQIEYKNMMLYCCQRSDCPSRVVYTC